MISFLRHALLLVLAAGLSWWLFLRAPIISGLPTAAQEGDLAPVSVIPQIPAPSAPIAEASAEQPARPEPADRAREQPSEPSEAMHPPAPPPPELGTPEGKEDAEPSLGDQAEDSESKEAESAPPEQAQDPTSTAGMGVLMKDADLLEAAKAELAGTAAKGFATVFVTKPDEQIDIARFFGEELVLVPKASLDPNGANPHWFRLRLGAGAPVVKRMAGRPKLEQFRQYRDLFDYDYARLPAALRALRRTVLMRNEIYVFAALIPPTEWAAVIGRRRQALVRAGRETADVRRFVIRYLRRADAAYDIAVDEIVFADGSRFSPGKTNGGI